MRNVYLAISLLVLQFNDCESAAFPNGSQIKKLEEDVAKAIRESDFKKAQSIQFEIDKIVELAKLQDAKAKAIRESDFSKAKELQSKIDDLGKSTTSTNQTSRSVELNIEPDDDGYYHVGDLILSPGQYQRAYGDMSEANEFELDSGRDEAFRWKDGVLPYKFRPRSISTKNKNKMLKVIKQFNDEMYGCINIRKATEFDNDFVTVQAGVGCSSAVGKYGGEQNLTLDNHCFSDDTIVHEFIHSFGFFHEQNRPDRDQFVEIRNKSIEFGKEHNFVKRKNSLTFGLPYDGLSVMHYQSYFFSVNKTDPSKQTIISKMNNVPTEKLGKSEWLTRTDIRKLEKMYKCKPKHERIKNLVSTILVSTGGAMNSDNTTEVINLEDDFSKCQDVGDFPIVIENAVGSYLGSFPVICGGYGSDSLNQCHQLKSGLWQPFATLGQRREGAAGIVHGNTFIIFGGRDFTTPTYATILSTTEIITEEGQVTPGPEMPVAVYWHSIASLDEKTWILTGGDTSTTSSTDETWFFDPVSQEFQEGPPLITGRRLHASATLQDQDTKENIVAVVGGYNSDGYIYDSTEFLRNGEWSPGPQMPKKLEGLSAVVLNGDLYAIGGRDENGDEQTAIHRLSCSSGNCAWTTMDQELTVGRAWHISMAVPNDLCIF